MTSHSGRKRRIRLAIWAFLLVAVDLSSSCARTEGSVDWAKFRTETDSLLDVESLLDLAGWADSLPDTSPPPEDGELAAWATLNIAEGLRRSETGDTYRLLRKATGWLQESEGSRALADSCRVRLAREYLVIGLPWRALEALEGAFESPDSARVLPTVFGQLVRIDSSLEDAGFDLESEVATRHGAQAWLRLLALPPSLGVLGTKDSTSLRSFGADLWVGPLEPMIRPLSLPSALLGVATTQTRELPGVNRLGQLLLIRRAQQAVLDLIAITPPGGPYDVARIESHPAIREFGIALYGVANPIVTEFHRVGRGIALSLSKGGDPPDYGYSIDDRDIIVAFPTPDGAGVRTIHTNFDPVIANLDVISVRGDGSEQIFLGENTGSGGYLWALLLDSRDGRVLLNVGGLPKGAIFFRQLDDDPELEAAVRGRIAVYRCVQCEGVFLTTIWDYDRQRGEYVPVRERRTASPYWIDVYGLGGVGPGMRLLGIAPSTLQRLDALDRGLELGIVVGIADALLGEYVPLLRETGRAGDAAEVAGRIIRALEVADADDEAPGLRAHAKEHRLLSLLDAGRASEALEEARQDLWLRSEHEKRQTLLQYYNLTTVFALTAGRPGEAYESLLGEARAGGDTVSTHHGNAALYYSLVGANQEAYERASIALDMAVDEQNELGAVIDMIHMARVAAELARPEESADWLARSVSVAKGRRMPDQLALGLWSAARIALRQGHPEVAMALLDEGFMSTSLDGWETGGANFLIDYGRSLRAAGEVDAAGRLFEAARHMARSTGRFDLVTATYWASRLAADRGVEGEALRLSQEAFDYLLDSRRELGPEGDKFSYLESRREVRDWHLQRLRRSGADVASLYRASQLAKMQVFRDLYLRDELSIPDPLLADFQVSLEEGDLAIDFLVTADASFALAIAPDTAWVVTLDASPDWVEDLREQLRDQMNPRNAQALENIRRRRVPEELKVAGRAAYDALLGPVLGSWASRRILIIPDESLIGMPWSALVTGGGEYLAQQYELAVVPLPALAVRRGPDRESPRRALVVTTPGAVEAERVAHAMGSELAGSDATALSRLRYGADEARRVVAELEAVDVLVLADSISLDEFSDRVRVEYADRERVLREIPGRSHLHLVAHGLFNPLEPMASAIFLGGNGDRALLTARDFLTTDMSGVELVTMSACQTGMSEVMPGAEPMGFVRGLLGAGAGAVVLTEWEVDDRSTRNLVQDFYRTLRTQRKSAALQQAQIQGIEEWHHPFFWASLTLYGYWN